MHTTIFAHAFALFLLMDAFGNIPIYLSVLKNITHKRQVKIIFREMVISLFLIIIFAIFGNNFLCFLGISQKTMQICGGVVLFILGIKMIFPTSQDGHFTFEGEPLIFPLAVPLVAGPGVLSAVMIYSHQNISMFSLIISICLAWFTTAVILLIAGRYSHKLDNRGLAALEKLMGLLLLMIAIEMFLEGVATVKIAALLS